MQIQTNLFFNNSRQRSQTIREIEAQCTQRERGEKIDLAQTTEKLSSITKQLNEEFRTVNEGRKANSAARSEYDLQSKQLAVLHDRVTALNKPKSILEWIKSPVVVAALSLTGIAALAFVGSRMVTPGTSSPPPPPSNGAEPFSSSNNQTPSNLKEHQEMVQKATEGDSNAMDTLVSRWKEGTVKESAQNQDSIREAYCNALSTKTDTGDLEAMTLLGWCDRKTRGTPHFPVFSLYLSYCRSNYGLCKEEALGNEPILLEYDIDYPTSYAFAPSRFVPANSSQVTHGNAIAQFAYDEIWWQNFTRPAPSRKEQDNIKTLYKIFPKYYGILKERVMNGDFNTLYLLQKHIWSICDKIVPDPKPKIVSGLCRFISKEEQAPIRVAYNSARMKQLGLDFNELKQKAMSGDDEALKMLEMKLLDLTLYLKDEEKKVIQKAYLLAKDYEESKKNAREGGWRGMQILEAMRNLKITLESEQEITSIRNEYKSAFPKRYREIQKNATNNDPKALLELQYYWNDPIFASNQVYFFSGDGPYS